MSLDHFYLHQAYQLALEHEGNTSPNPPVGAVIVKKDGKAVGAGSHVRAGAPHAEIVAMANAGGPQATSGATLYCSLEPCAHHGKTPPCSAAIVAAGIRRVVYGVRDRNPLVNGRGEEALVQAGIEVKQLPLPLLQQFYLPFFTTFESGRPYAIAKVAVTANGIISPADRNSRWITGETSLRWVHHLRATCDAIVVGADTVLLDRPSLTVRLSGTDRKPVRIVMDSRFKLLPEDCSLLQDDAPILICGSAEAPQGKDRAWEAHSGVRTLRFGSLPELMGQWLDLGIRKVMIEGGQKVYTMFHAAGLIDEYVMMIAPRLLMGQHFLNVLGGPEQSLSESTRYATLPPLDLDGDVVLRMRTSRGKAVSHESPQ